MSFEALKWVDGQSNMSGLHQIGFIVAAVDVATLTLDEDNMEVGALTLESSASLKPIYSTQGKSNLEENHLGEIDTTGMESKFTFVYPGTQLESRKFAKAARNTKPILIVKERTGQWRILGTPEDPCSCESVALKTGAGGDERGLTIIFKSIQDGPAPSVSDTVMSNLV